MDDSFGAAMAGLVIEDASRMSGARFADARGTGVARRVRTRRRVRAAGMGGASAVAVGAIAVGATQVPWEQLSAASSSANATAHAEPGTSPFECGFVFPTASQSVEEMTIEDVGWLTADEVIALLDRRLNTHVDSAGNPVEGPHIDVTMHVDATQLLPTFTYVDPEDPAAKGGWMGTSDPVLNPPTIDGLQVPPGTELKESSAGVTFVAVSQATVVGTVTSPWQPEEAPPLTWTSTVGGNALALINPEGAFSPCPGVTLGDDLEIYAVAGRMTMDADRVITGPFYAWSEIPKS